MKELIEYVVKGLVAHPDAVVLTESASESTIQFKLEVHPEDVGKVIGREGRTISALRAVVGATAQKHGLRARVDVLDERKKSSAGAEAQDGAPALVEG